MALCKKHGFELISSQDRTSDWHTYVVARAAAFDGETVQQASEHLKAVVQVFARCDNQERSRAQAFAHQVGRCFDRKVVSGWRFLFQKV